MDRTENMRICVKHIAVMMVTSVALAACGGGGDSSGSGASNLPPIISGSPPTALAAGNLYTFTPTAADPDGDALTFRATGLPTWATFNSTTGTLAGTPAEANVGSSQTITIEVTDSKAWTQLPGFQIQISSQATTPPPNNVAPTLTGTPAVSAFVGTAYTFQPVGDDANDDELTYSVTNLPSWLTFTAATGAVSGTPAAGNVGSTGPVVITASDGTLTASLQFTITVQNTPAPTNRAPAISGTPGASATVGRSYAFNPVGSDPDGNNLVYSIQNRPSWATFNTATGRLSGTPAAANVGTSARITITVSDGTLTASLPSFTIQVNAAANRPPVITGSPLLSINVLSAYAFQPSASDPDGNTLTFSVQNRPTWATFSTSTGRLSGTPSLLDLFVFNNIIITVSDGNATASLPSFNLSVLQQATGSATVNWTPPTTNTDGSTLSNLSGYRVVYGRAQDDMDRSESVNNAGATNITIGNLAAGTWYFAVAAVNAQGAESDLSNIATKVIAN
jgi:hypothetical protein